jgi:transcription antitermination factor NusG
VRQCFPSSTEKAVAPDLVWCVIRTRSNRERDIANILPQKGLEQYLPTYRSRHRWSDRFVESDQPLFPGYVFCRFDLVRRMSILKIPAWCLLLALVTRLMWSAIMEIEAVRSVLHSGLAAEPHPFLREGERVRVSRGSLEALEGVLVKKKSQWGWWSPSRCYSASSPLKSNREWVHPVASTFR